MNLVQGQLSRRVSAWVVALGLAAGRLSAAPPPPIDYEFFPPPPDEPHLQFLTSFSSEKEMGGNSSRSFMSFVTGQKPREKQISKAYGVAAHDHKFYICDTDYGAVLIADLKTRSMSAFMARGQGVLREPLNISIDAGGQFYVADSGRDQVVVFDKDQNYVAAIGKMGEMKPRDVAVTQSRIYVADIQNHNVHVYDKATRNPLFTIPREPDAANLGHKLFSPTNLAVDTKGRLYVSDTGAFRIQIYDATTGIYQRTVGGMGDSLGEFARVKGIAVDHESRLYAVDAMSQVVQIFNDQGRLLTWFGEPAGSNRAQNLPAKVMIDYDDASYFKSTVAPGFVVEYLVVIINQIGSHMVSIYAFGHQQ